MPRVVNGPSPLVYSPRSLAEALALFVANPHARVLAGGTAGPVGDESDWIDLAPVTISLHLAEDLKKVAYGERSLDLGGGLTLNQLLMVGGTWVPPILKEASRIIGNSSLRNLATLGGNLCQPGVLGDLFPPLVLLGGQIEFRNLRGGRWVTAASRADERDFALAPGEILSRVRVPQEEWPLWFYQKIGNIRTPWDERLALCAVARSKNGLLEALRLAFHIPHAGLVRVRELEAELAGLSLPLSHRVRSQSLERIAEAVDALPIRASTFQRDRVLHMTRWVLTRLDDD